MDAPPCKHAKLNQNRVRIGSRLLMELEHSKHESDKTDGDKVSWELITSNFYLIR